MLTEEVAAIIRVLRTKRGMPYEDLSAVGVQRSISALEQAKVSISVDKLAELASVLQFDLVTLITLCVALSNNESPRATLERATTVLDQFLDSGGEQLIKAQFDDGKLIRRSRGKPLNRDNATKILKLKSEGHTQAYVVRTLGLAKSTVNRYWRGS
ncbi:helix-turn-helix transcriptional regulator [Pseudomonas sp. LF-5]|uniref:helix-turn-helix domain-containing protein n=1 Tax=Pseudomonas sp. LF-5 TaxID=3031121 RepID=UPI0030A4DC6F